uniref:Uncharacterized LOC114662072 n=1 Tax=Erpetoichthys calabaricus TaxID=27687 RepID=A0A8C4SA53_ERPCA
MVWGAAPKDEKAERETNSDNASGARQVQQRQILPGNQHPEFRQPDTPHTVQFFNSRLLNPPTEAQSFDWSAVQESALSGHPLNSLNLHLNPNLDQEPLLSNHHLNGPSDLGRRPFLVDQVKQHNLNFLPVSQRHHQISIEKAEKQTIPDHKPIKCFSPLQIPVHCCWQRQCPLHGDCTQVAPDQESHDSTQAVIQCSLNLGVDKQAVCSDNHLGPQLSSPQHSQPSLVRSSSQLPWNNFNSSPTDPNIEAVNPLTHYRTFRGTERETIEKAVQTLLAGDIYWGPLLVEDAHRLLLNTRVGVFLVRDSMQGNHLFSLSVRTSTGPRSLRIPFKEGRFWLKDLSADCVAHLLEMAVERTRTQPLKCDEGIHIVLSRPLRKSPLPKLQELCRQAIMESLRGAKTEGSWADLIAQLPLQPMLIKYILEFPFRL